MTLRRAFVTAAVAAATAAAVAVVPAVAMLSRTAPENASLQDLGHRHGLAIGSAISNDALADPAGATYRQIASTQFSTVTAENVMKWESLEPTRGTYNWAPADAFMAFAKQNDQQVRGHVLVWHNQLPAWLTEGVASGAISKTELRDLLKKHITDVVTHFKGRIWQWDVVNEAVTDSWDSPDGNIGYKGFWNTNLGPGFIADAFRWARAADSRALLFYNDYNIDAFGDHGPKDKTQFVYNMVKSLRASGVPIDGVGSQAHLSTRYANFDALQVADMLNTFAKLGLATALTEVDVRILMTDGIKAGTPNDLNPALQAQAANYSALMQGCLASESCLSFTVWGFDDEHNWTTYTDLGSGKGGEAIAAIYDAKYRPKRALNTLKADLAFSGPPFVKDRIRPRPAR